MRTIFHVIYTHRMISLQFETGPLKLLLFACVATHFCNIIKEQNTYRLVQSTS
jgi:hypothetical protein